MKFLRGLFLVLSKIVYAVIVAAALTMIPIAFGYMPAAISGGSAESVLPHGYLTYYRETPFEQLKTGTVVVYDSGSGLAADKIVSMNKITKTVRIGSAGKNGTGGEEIEYARVMGNITKAAVPFGGYFISYIMRWYTLAVLAAVLVVHFVLGARYAARCEKGSGKAGRRRGKLTAAEFFSDLEGTDAAPSLSRAAEEEPDRCLNGGAPAGSFLTGGAAGALGDAEQPV